MIACPRCGVDLDDNDDTLICWSRAEVKQTYNPTTNEYGAATDTEIGDTIEWRCAECDDVIPAQIIKALATS